MQYYCRACQDRRVRPRAATNEAARKRRRCNPAVAMVAAARKRAKAKGIPFCISARDLVIPAICPVLAIPLAVGDGRPSDASPSLDRIVPALGYVKGNVVVISMRANRLKSDATVDELRALADFFEIATPVTPRRWRTNPT